MAKKKANNEEDLLMDDELAAAFLDEDAPAEESAPAVDDEAQFEGDDELLEDAPGQLAVDVYETKEKLIVKARVAGVQKDDLDVSIADNTVSVRGTLTSGDEISAENYFVQECYWGEFTRSISLPVQVKEDEIEAILKDGVLTIGFTKVEQDTVRKIEIQ